MIKPAAKPAIVPEQAAAPGQTTASASAQSGPVFHGLFRSTGSPEPVAPVVSALWSTPAPSPAPSASAPAKPQPLPETPAPAASSGPLDLFQEQLPDARALFRGRV